MGADVQKIRIKKIVQDMPSYISLLELVDLLIWLTKAKIRAL